MPLDLQALNSSSSSSVATSSSNGTAGLSQVLLGHLSSYQGMGQVRPPALVCCQLVACHLRLLSPAPLAVLPCHLLPRAIACLKLSIPLHAAPLCPPHQLWPSPPRLLCQHPCTPFACLLLSPVQASVQCRAGCSCNSTTIDGHWRKQASLQVMHSFMVRWQGSWRGLL